MYNFFGDNQSQLRSNNIQNLSINVIVVSVTIAWPKLVFFYSGDSFCSFQDSSDPNSFDKYK